MVSEQIIKRLSEVIKSDEDLNKLNTIKSNLIKDKNLIESRLKIEQNDKYQLLIKSMDDLQKSSKLLKELKENLLKIDKLKYDSINSINNYELFDQSSILYGNFERCVLLYDGFSQLNEKCQELNDLLDRETQQDYEGNEPMDNLLVIHYELTKLWDFKDEVYLGITNLNNSRSSNNFENERILKSSFDNLNNVIIPKFDNLIRLISDKDVFENILRYQNSQFLIKLFKIIEFEQFNDLKVDLINDHNNNPNNSNNTNNLNNTNTSIGRTSKRGYLKKFLNYLKSSIDSMFESANERDDYDVVLDSFNDWYYSELQIFMIGLSSCCPKEWNFFETYILKWYQMNLRNLVKSIISKDPSNEVILKILDLNYDNTVQLNKTFNIKKDQLINYQVLLPNEKETILKDYVMVTINKSKEWFNNKYQIVFENFVKRSKVPNDIYDKLGIETSKDIYLIMSQNVNVLIDTNEVSALLEYMEYICKDLLISKTNEFMSLIDKESEGWIEYINSQDDNNNQDNNGSNRDSVTGNSNKMDLLPRYITTIANDAVRGANGFNEIQKRMVTLTNIKYHNQINDLMGTCLMNTYIALGNKCIVKLVDYSIIEIQSLNGFIFTDLWYDFLQGKEIIENSLDIIINDYIKSLKEFLDPELYFEFLELSLPSYLIDYMKQIKKTDNKSLFKLNKINDILKRDEDLISASFKEHASPENLQLIKDIFEMLNEFISVYKQGGGVKDIIERFKYYKMNKFNDLPVEFLKDLLNNLIKNFDSNSSEVRSLFRELNQWVNQLNGTESNETLFSRY